MKKGDRDPNVSAILKAGTAIINLTGATVKFIMRHRSTGVVKVNASCTVVTPAAGSVRYDWGASDTDTAGQYDAEFEVTQSGGDKITCPNGRHLDVLILDDIG